MWRGAVGRAYLWPPLSSGGASRARPWSVSTSRSSNRTCGFPASGSRTRATLSPTESCAFGPPGGPVPTSHRDIRWGTASRPGGIVLDVSGATTDAADTACVDPPRGRRSLRDPDRSSWTNPPASDSEREPWPWHPTGAGSAPVSWLMARHNRVIRVSSMDACRYSCAPSGGSSIDQRCTPKSRSSPPELGGLGSCLRSSEASTAP